MSRAQRDAWLDAYQKLKKMEAEAAGRDRSEATGYAVGEFPNPGHVGGNMDYVTSLE